MSVAHSTSSVMISRRRSGPTAVAMSMECTTSANRTVTCLYSAGFETLLTAAPHSSQKFAVGRSSTLQALQDVIASPRPSPCDPRSRAPWPAGTTRSVRHRQHRTGRPRAARPHTPGMSLRPSSVNPRCPAALRIGVENGRLLTCGYGCPPYPQLVGVTHGLSGAGRRQPPVGEIRGNADQSAEVLFCRRTVEEHPRDMRLAFEELTKVVGHHAVRLHCGVQAANATA